MTEPNVAVPPEPDDLPPRVWVPTGRDAFGQPCDFIEVDAEAAGGWDASVWGDRPPI